MAYTPAEICALPTVNLAEIKEPKDGIFVARPAFCAKQFAKDTRCRDFYRSLAANPSEETLFQCPFGFSTYPVSIGTTRIAITSFVPFPRAGGDAERARAKEFPQCKIAADAVSKSAAAMKSAEESRVQSIAEQLKRYPSALHEVRKLNRTIKQEAERLCRQQSPANPDDATAPLVSIWKSSELMTYQFGILELISNETLAEVPRKTESKIFQICDKCARIYELTATGNDVKVDIRGDSPRALVCDKTFPIIPTVLIENAIKYSVRHQTIHIRVKDMPTEKKCTIAVENVANQAPSLPNIFAKGVKGGSGGLGVGLYLANLVAKQHGSELHLNRQSLWKNQEKFIFSLTLDTI